MYDGTATFGGTGNLNALNLLIDPNGRQDGSGSLEVWIYYKGQITSREFIKDNTVNSSGTYSADPNREPDWWSWDN